MDNSILGFEFIVDFFCVLYYFEGPELKKFALIYIYSKLRYKVPLSTD